MQKCLLLLALTICTVSVSTFGQKQQADLKASVDRGKEIYIAQCMSCHMDHGQGIEEVYPPLAGSDYLMADARRAIRTVVQGLAGEILVNKKTYNLDMVGFPHLSDQEVSDVLNYIRNSWGNKGKAITPDEVSGAR